MIYSIILEFLLVGLVVYISTGALLNYLSNKNKKIQKRQSLLKWVMVVTLSPILTLGLFCLLHCEPSTMKFDARRWAESPKVHRPMASYIVEKGFLTGKTNEEVTKLLGNRYELDGVNHDTIFYIIDDNSYGSDPEALYIKFKNGQVVKTGISIN